MFTTRPEIVGTFGVASSTQWLAAQAAMGVLERGGNAFDAAVAGAFVLNVVVGGDPWSEGRLCVCSRTRDRHGALVLGAAATPRFMQAHAVGR